MGPKPANKRPKSVVGHKVVLKGSNKPAKKIPSIIKQPARINRSGSGRGDNNKVVKSSAKVTKILKQDFQRPVAPQRQRQQRQPPPPQQQLLQQQQQYLPQQQQQQPPPTQPNRGRGPVGHGLYSGSAAFMQGSMALQTAQAVASNRGHPKHQEVGELLNTMNKGWIDQGKFAELLQGILF